MLAIFLLAITSATSQHPNAEVLAQVRDMETCQRVAAMLNDYTKDEPDLVFMCREVHAAKA